MKPLNVGAGQRWLPEEFIETLAARAKTSLSKPVGSALVCMMLLVPIAWAKRVWALPFLSVLAPSERYYEQRKRRHKKIADWGRQMIRQLRRWLPNRPLVVVADSSYAVIELLACALGFHQPVTVITRLRLDAALYEPAPERKKGTNGRPRLKGTRQPTLAHRLADPQTMWETVTVSWYGAQQRTVQGATGTALWYHTGLPTVALRWVLIRDPQGKFVPQALLCTDQGVTATQIIEWFVLRWQVEVTFHEVRSHLGVETRAAVVRPGYLAYYACLARTLFISDNLRSSVALGAAIPRSSNCLVYQNSSYVC